MRGENGKIEEKFYGSFLQFFPGGMGGRKCWRIFDFVFFSCAEGGISPAGGGICPDGRGVCPASDGWCSCAEGAQEVSVADLL